MHKRLDHGSQLQPKHVAVNKLVKLVLCVTKLIHTIFPIIFVGVKLGLSHKGQNMGWGY